MSIINQDHALVSHFLTMHARTPFCSCSHCLIIDDDIGCRRVDGLMRLAEAKPIHFVVKHPRLGHTPLTILFEIPSASTRLLARHLATRTTRAESDTGELEKRLE